MKFVLEKMTMERCQSVQTSLKLRCEVLTVSVFMGCDTMQFGRHYQRLGGHMLLPGSLFRPKVDARFSGTFVVVHRSDLH